MSTGKLSTIGDTNTPSSQIIHATAMQVNSVGVLIIGESGCGKSELALHLLERRHALISDDAVKLTATAQTLLASAPTPFCQQLHLRQIGLIQPCRHFNSSALCDYSSIELVIELSQQLEHSATLDLTSDSCTYLDVSLPLYHLSNQTYCSLALKLETLVKQFKIKHSDTLCVAS